MKKALFLALIALVSLLASACGSSEPVAIESVTLSRDDGSGSPGETVTAFSPSDRVFHATIQLNRIETGLKVKLAWIAVDAGGAQNELIDESEFTGLAVNTINGQIELPQDWPTGKYRLDIFLNDELKRSVDFTVDAA